MYVSLFILMLLLPAHIRSHQKEANKKAENTQNINTPAPMLFPCASVTCQISQSSTYGAQQQSSQQSKNVWEKAFAPETWSQWGLLLTAAIAAFIYWHTLKGTHKAADAALRGVALQEVLNRQWVRLEKWSYEGQTPRGSGSAIRDDERIIHFSCEIVNPTSMTLTVTRFELTALDRVYTAAFTSFLIPGASVHQPIRVIVTSNERIQEFNRSRLDFDFSGIITFIDAFGQKREQPFAFHFNGGMGGAKISVLKQRPEATP